MVATQSFEGKGCGGLWSSRGRADLIYCCSRFCILGGVCVMTRLVISRAGFCQKHQVLGFAHIGGGNYVARTLCQADMSECQTRRHTLNTA
ncbi:unnamed protein product [Prunus armeniaca]|uniref:Uncharacterized protein n=1 Tax=Prunus armeniaca TaxID=36596 RepID=A0A6J5W5P2_PRUAR|nr:unnamed protein product [Prunus armeniaca]